MASVGEAGAAVQELGYRPNLDALRGLAVAAVLFSHFFVTPFDLAGTVGVTLFFVLSGFLITKLLLEEQDRGGIALGGFYLRRARRLLPALPLALVLCAAVNASLGKPWELHTLGAVFYLSNLTKIADPHGVGAFTHLWSLAVEEHFYIVWPAVVMALPRRRLAHVAVAVAVVVPIARLPHATDYLWAHHATWFRVDAMAIGALLALSYTRLRRPSVPFVWLAVAVMGVFCARSMLTVYLGWGITAVALAAAVAVTAATLAPQRTWPGITHLGKISYGVYLLHMPVAAALRGTPTSVRVAGIVVALILAEVSYRLIETPWRSGRLDQTHTQEPAVVPESVTSVAARPADADRQQLTR